MASVLTYHKIGRQAELGLPAVSRKRFASHLDLLRELGKSLVLARDAACADNENAVALTFDDGYDSVYTEAFPEMAARGVTGTVFLVVGAIGRSNAWDVRLSWRPFKHLSWIQLEKLTAYGFEIGSHTMSHRDLTGLAQDDLEEELARSRHLLEDRLGVEVTSVAYPFGRVDARVSEAAARAGYRCGFCSLPVTASHGGRQVMMTGRMSVYGIDGRVNLLAKLGASRGYRLEVLKNRVFAQLSRGTPLVKR